MDKRIVAMAVMAKLGFHLHHHASHSPHTFILIQNPLCRLYCRSISISNHRLLLLLSSWPLHMRRSRQRVSNAESYNNFGDNDEIEDYDDGVEEWVEALEDYIDSIWILKVFSSFGWMLPVIISSLLLANGPKAFLMALALPLGQSTFTFALQRFQKRGKPKPKPKPNNKTKKGRSRAYSSRTSKFEEAAEWIGSERARKKKKGYQSWVYKKDVSVSGDDRTATNFGGWDELDAGMEPNVRSSRRAAQESRESRRTPAGKGKNRRRGENYGPSLLRMLVSIFPFLSSWTNVL